MKKVINKTEREHIITSLAVAAAGAKAQKIFDELGKLRKQVAEVLRSNWQDNFPGISDKDSLELIRSGGANRLQFSPSIYGKGEKEDQTKKVGSFGRLVWVNTGTDSEKRRIAVFAGKIFNMSTSTQGTVEDGLSSGWSSQIYLSHTYSDIIYGKQPDLLYDASLPVPEGENSAVNDALVTLHKKVVAQLQQLKDLIFSVEDAHQALGAALAPVKTAQALAELMPEAVKFFPPSLTYVKPSKEIADPKAINEIRAKLKKGLPI